MARGELLFSISKSMHCTPILDLVTGYLLYNTWLDDVELAYFALAMEATLVLYDGAPFHPDGNALFNHADKVKVTHFGTSAKFIDVEKTGLSPSTHDLSSVRTILSTGSPLLPESFDYIYSQIKSDVCVSSISVEQILWVVLPLEILMTGVQRRTPSKMPWHGRLFFHLRLNRSWDKKVNWSAEIVFLLCLSVFGTIKGNRFKSAYFERFGVWHHGDWAELTEREAWLYGSWTLLQSWRCPHRNRRNISSGRATH